MAFAFTVYDLKTNEILGGGLYPDREGEGAFVVACQESECIYPNREIHVEEISVEEYLAQGGYPTQTGNTEAERKKFWRGYFGFGEDKYDERMTEVSE